MTNREFTRICKDVMTPIVKYWWTEEVWKRGTSITKFRQMAEDFDETGQEQTHLLVAALEERGVTKEEMLELSYGDDPIDRGFTEIDTRVHDMLSADLQEAFEVSVRNAPKKM
jgi:hypothetical protein